MSGQVSEQVSGQVSEEEKAKAYKEALNFLAHIGGRKVE